MRVGTTCKNAACKVVSTQQVPSSHGQEYCRSRLGARLPVPQGAVLVGGGSTYQLCMLLLIPSLEQLTLSLPSHIPARGF